MTKYEIHPDDGKIPPDTSERRVERDVYRENDIANSVKKNEEWFHPPAVSDLEDELNGIVADIEESGGVFESSAEEDSTIAKVNTIYLATGNKRAVELWKYLEKKKRAP